MAKRMGLPVARFIAATNSNNVVPIIFVLAHLYHAYQ